MINLDCVAGSMKFGAMTSEYGCLENAVRSAATACGMHIDIYTPLLRNSDHYNFAVNGVPALRLVAGFGEKNSKLQNVLTERDNRSLVEEKELELALAVTRELVRASIGLEIENCSA